MTSLTGKTALITGSTDGVGRVVAIQLAAAGARILTHGRDRDRGASLVAEIEAAGGRAEFLAADLSSLAEVRRLADAVRQRTDRLDILINNAGIGSAGGGASRQTSFDGHELRFAVNYLAGFLLTHLLLPLLKASAPARIVNVSSEVGSISSTLNPDSPLWPMASVPYPASKAALNMVTAMYAKELAGAGIKVNAANPGYCATDLNGHTGFRTPEQGAAVCVHLATLPADGPTGQLWGHLWALGDGEQDGVLPW